MSNVISTQFRVVFKVHMIAFLPLLFAMLSAMPHSAAAQAGKTENGQKLFEQNCAKCHGPDGSANTAVGKALGAKDLRAAEAQKLSDSQISTQIGQGKGNMPPFEGTFSKTQMGDLIAYVRILGKKSAGKKS